MAGKQTEKKTQRHVTKKDTLNPTLRRQNSLKEALSFYAGINEQGAIQFVSPAIAHVLGYKFEELIGRSITEFIQPDDLPVTSLLLDYSGKQPQQIQSATLHLMGKDGQWHVFEAYFEKLPVNSGNIQVIISLAENNTGGSADDNELIKNAEFYRIITENMKDTIWLMDMDLKTIFISPSVSYQRGFTLEEIQQSSLEQQLTPSSLAVVLQAVADEFTPENLARKDHAISRTLELEFFRKDGTTFWSENTISLVRDIKGDPVGILCAGRDISESKLAESAVKESEEKYRTLFENIPDGMYRVSPEGKILVANQTLIHMLGFQSKAEMIKSSAASDFFVPRADRLAWREKLERYGFLRNYELTLERKDGTKLYALDNVHVVRDKHGITLYYEGTLTDITELKQREHELEAIVNVSTALRTAQTRSEMLPVILAQATKLLNATDSMIWLVDPTSNEMVCEYALGQASRMIGVHMSSDTGVIAKIISTGAPYLNIEKSPELPVMMQENRKELLHSLAGVPLTAYDHVLGALVINSLTLLTNEDMRLLTVIADISANAINRTTLHEQTLHRSEQLVNVNAFSRSFAETLEVPEIFDRLHHAIEQLWPEVNTIRLFEFDSDLKLMNAVFVSEDEKELPPESLPPSTLDPKGEDALSQAILVQKPIFTSRPARELDLAKAQRIDPTPQSILSVPMLARGNVIGIIQVESRGKNRYTQEDAGFMSVLANTAAVAIENANLFNETKQRLEQVQALHEIESTINSNLDLQVIFNVVLSQTLILLQTDVASVYLLNSQTNMLELVASKGLPFYKTEIPQLRVNETLAGRSVIERRTIRIPDLEKSSLQNLLPKTYASEHFISYYAVPLIAKGQVKGVLELFYRVLFIPQAEWEGFLDTLTAQMATAIDNITLFESLQHSNMELALAYDTTLEGWLRAMDLRDKETEGHTTRVTEMTVQLARMMGFSETELVHVRRGAMLHDIGKIGIPDSILLKPGPLTPEERKQIEKHPQFAYDLLSPIAYLQSSLEIPYCHHERWDGSGYPRHLRSEAIPLIARIFAVVDVWDALTSDRPYRKAWTEEKTLEYIREQTGKHFDPAIVEAFMKFLKETRPATSFKTE
jgi:PAS domain S-box-containing protein